MTRRPRRGRGAGERSLAQRPLPLAPPPETWGRFDSPPHPPNDSQGRGCGPSPLPTPKGNDVGRPRVNMRGLDSPSGIDRVARSEAERAGLEIKSLRRPPTKAAPKLPNAGKHNHCSLRLRRTRWETLSLQGHRFARPPF